jgi:hypothetical protein
MPRKTSRSESEARKANFENTQLLLLPELVPKPLWGKSVFRTIPKREWNKIREIVMAESEGRCQICGTLNEKGMTCHEIWSYGDSEQRAILTGFRITCRECSLAHHIGLAKRQGLEEAAIQQLLKVNRISLLEAKQLIAEAKAKWRHRNEHEWKVFVSSELIKRFPILSEFGP